MSVATEVKAPSREEVVYVLARRMYESFCQRKNWDPHPAPYVDAGSIRNANIAVDLLGYEDDVLG